MDVIIDDILHYIFSFIKEGSTFKSVLFTCRRWHEIVLKVHCDGRIIFANHLVTLLKFLHDTPWNYCWLSENPNITWEIVMQNPNKSWDYNRLSENPSITWENVMQNPDKPWNYNTLSTNTFKR